MTTERLSAAALDDRLIRRFGPAARPDQVGIVHLGIGAFHRAHQAVFTQLAAATAGESRWGILGVTQRSRRVADQLTPQDGLYGVLQKGADGTELTLIGAVVDVAFPGDETPRIIRAIAAPATHIVSLTVTEKGYRATADGELDLHDADLQADIAALVDESQGADAVRPARTPIGLLVRGLAARARGIDPAPLTVVCCDNIVDNGRFTERLVHEVLDAALAAGGDDLHDVRTWIEGGVAFPSTMVDRIVPATTEDDRVEAEHLLGLRDEGLVVAEPFRQWVIEDRFAGPRPAWERAGAIITDDVSPFEQAKLRMLNGAHSLLAYAGSLRGFTTIADAVRDERLAAFARGFLTDDVIPTLVAPAELDLHDYAASLLERFANPGTGHTTIQVAMDGSKKLPIRLFGTVVDDLRRGVVPLHAARAFAAWIVFVAIGRTITGEPLVLDDPRAGELMAATGRGSGEPREPARLVAAVLALPDLVPAEVAAHEQFAAAVTAAVAELLAEYGSAPASAAPGVSSVPGVSSAPRVSA